MSHLSAAIKEWVRTGDFPTLPSGRSTTLNPIVGPFRIRFSPRDDDDSPLAASEVKLIASGNETNVERLREAGLQLEHAPVTFPYEPQLEGDSWRNLLAERDYESKFGGILAAGMWIAGKKAELAFDRLREPAIVTDIGLAWRHMPQLYATTKMLFDEDTSGLGRNFKQHICSWAHSCGDTRAVAVAAMAVFNGRFLRTWAIGVSGLIASKPTGDGYGFDDIFCPNTEVQAARAGAGQEGPLTWSQLAKDEVKTHHPFRALLVDKLRAEVLKSA